MIIDILSTPLGSVVGLTVIGLVIGFIASRINKTLGVSLFAGILGSWSGGIGMFVMSTVISDKGYGYGIVAILTYAGAVFGSLILVFATHLFLLKNRVSTNSPAASQNFSEAPISQFCTQCGNRLEAGRHFCPACGSAAQQ